MRDNLAQLPDPVAEYVRRTVPVNWVIWWSDAEEGDAKRRLYDVLFDPSTDALRDLTVPEIRERVLDAVVDSPGLQEIVARHAGEFWQRVEAEQKASADGNANI
jgi:hypothetical protein